VRAYTAPVPESAEPRKWATTEEIIEAAGVSKATVFRWVQFGVLPQFETVYGRGRYARWPIHAPDQARWVDQKLRSGWTLPEIKQALERGEFSGGQS
jgi:hypothetical protein